MLVPGPPVIYIITGDPEPFNRQNVLLWAHLNGCSMDGPTENLARTMGLDPAEMKSRQHSNMCNKPSRITDEISAACGARCRVKETLYILNDELNVSTEQFNA